MSILKVAVTGSTEESASYENPKELLGRSTKETSSGESFSRHDELGQSAAETEV